MSDDIFTRSLPEVTFEYLRKTVRRERDDDDADEQRERQGGSLNVDVLSINSGAPNTYETMSRDRSSAADVQGSNPKCLNEESDDTVEATAIFAPEDH